MNKLENNKYIVFNSKDRTLLQDDLFKRLTQSIVTEEDLNEQVRSQVARASEAISEQNLTETEAYQSQKRAIRSKLADNEVQGFYLHKTLRAVCEDVCKFLFDSRFVEDVFESDEAIQKLVMETIQKFDESKLA
ncbi:MAG: DUF507 family protein [Bdellovibrionota bacterium]